MSNDALRARFEALLKPESRCTFLDAHNRPTDVYVENHIRGMWEGFQLGHATGMEDAANMCDARSIENWNMYKGCGSNYFEGKADGADELASTIRAKAKGEKL